MVRLKVKVVGLDQLTMVPVVVITDYEEKGFIPIMIGVWEATAISQGLEGQKLPRPMTHDLFKNVLDALDVKIDRILIHDLRDETYYARICLKTKDGELSIDARPSDAIALALRSGAPIYISDEVAEQALISIKPVKPMEMKPIDEEEIAEFRRVLEDLSPDEFLKKLQG